MELQDFKPPRPMTHDLMKKTIEALQGTIKKIVISEIIENTFYSIIEIETKDKRLIKIDSRPSDAIAISVRVNIPIFVSENVMSKAKMVNADKDEEETKNFKSFIDNIKPEDFQQYLDKQN